LPNFNGQTDGFKALHGVADTAATAKFRKIVSDPTGGSDQVLRVEYEEGSMDSNSNGGTTFYAIPPVSWNTAKTIQFCYKVLFEEDFNFNLDGKLPGLYGDLGQTSTDNWSTRYMWRQGGAGELYPTINDANQSEAFCEAAHQGCTSKGARKGAAQLSLNRGSFKFTPGVWNQVCQTITATKTGKILVVANDNSKPAIDLDTIFLSGFSGIKFDSFFGGGSGSECPKNQFSYFKDISVKILA